MVNLTRIYTRTGDAGETRLSDLSATTKTDPRVAAYGDVDEANSILGIVTALDALPQPLIVTLRTIQNELFDVGADLSNPVVPDPTWEPLRITQPSIDRLEAWCDEYTEGLSSLASFILPGGTQSSAYLHLARTVVRRAERSAWAAAQAYGLDDDVTVASGGLNPLAIAYLNRLSDLLFILARVANSGHDVMWVPGKDREPAGERARKHRARIEATQQSDS
ncbi:cob(I)yrinic acid a,c-diamide adenosyltransferase [Propioniciclava flava]|uniref:Corrinoid adenosyltransferase n=1 Tax=Propioniciclava flava TaxID=2072026 RepID=A0A4Q2EJF4_9ACTN|nr:cob(I)yrinic acid a,c-diamide adenosyltransferase [Propioniciclava flava]RXW33313.1 ATP:cob(I)alamin adenosyltransferase [Propioniciclava flava]